MRHHYGFQCKTLCILASLVGFVAFSVEINNNALAQSSDGSRLSVITEGKTLKLEYTPSSESMSLDGVVFAPPVEGVPKPERDLNAPETIAILPTWTCNPKVGVSPFLQCHPVLEDRLGCNGGGASTMCDTQETPNGTSCVCDPL